MGNLQPLPLVIFRSHTGGRRFLPMLVDIPHPFKPGFKMQVSLREGDFDFIVPEFFENGIIQLTF